MSWNGRKVISGFTSKRSGCARNGSQQRFKAAAHLLVRQVQCGELEAQAVVGIELDLLAPMGVVEMQGVEAQHRFDQLAVGGVIGGLHPTGDQGQSFGDRMAQQCDRAQHPEAATTTAAQREEQLRVLMGIHPANASIGGDHFRFQQVARPGAVALGEAAETAAEDEAAAGAHAGAAAPCT